jgi:cellulose synthase/poly-beta-1,6-N-acetylglucosamine synthase-like glycosyltransferase
MVFIQGLFLFLSLLLTFLFFMYGFNHYYLLSAIHRYRIPKLSPEAAGQRPPVSIHLPIYNEKYVICRLVEACVGMAEEYGRDKVRISILDDSKDDTVQVVDDIVQEFIQRGYKIEVLRRPNRQGYKAGALQMALERTEEEFIAIFDADYIPRADFLVRTVPYFLQDDRVGIVQSRWSHLNRYYNILTSAIAIGIDVHFLVEQTGRYAIKCLQNFNGSGGVLRKSALLEAGGWQADTLAEDLDASYRMQLKGCRVLFLRDLQSPAELPPTVPSFKKQQGRWANGSLRTARKILPKLLPDSKFRLAQRLEAFIHLTGYIIHPMMFISFLLASLATIFDIDTFLIHTHMLSPFGGNYAALQPGTAYLVHTLSWGVMDVLIILCMVATWVSPIVTLRLQKLRVRKNLASLAVLYLLGAGISLSNTIEAAKALFSNRVWEFKRTPKYAILQDRQGWQSSKYQIPLDFEFFLELALVILGIIAIVFAFYRSQLPVLIILVPYTNAYLFVSWLTLRQSRQSSVT